MLLKNVLLWLLFGVGVCSFGSGISDTYLPLDLFMKRKAMDENKIINNTGYNESGKQTSSNKRQYKEEGFSFRNTEIIEEVLDDGRRKVSTFVKSKLESEFIYDGIHLISVEYFTENPERIDTFTEVLYVSDKTSISSIGQPSHEVPPDVYIKTEENSLSASYINELLKPIIGYRYSQGVYLFYYNEIGIFKKEKYYLNSSEKEIIYLAYYDGIERKKTDPKFEVYDDIQVEVFDSNGQQIQFFRIYLNEGKLDYREVFFDLSGKIESYILMIDGEKTEYIHEYSDDENSLKVYRAEEVLKSLVYESNISN